MTAACKPGDSDACTVVPNTDTKEFVMHHPYSYRALQQLEADRRHDLQQGLRATRSPAMAPPEGRAWVRALRSVRGW